MDLCPICSANPKSLTPTQNPLGFRVVCSRCGGFWIPERLFKKLPGPLSSEQEAILSTAIRSRQRQDKFPRLTQALVDHILATGSLPNPAQQGLNLLLWLGNKFGHRTSGTYKLCDLDAAGIMGALSDIDARMVVEHLIEGRLLKTVGESKKDIRDVRMTLKGWDRYHELRRGALDSCLAFMAMPFTVQHLDKAFLECFKPAVMQVGFELRTVEDAGRAGLIDDHIQVEIRRSKFMVAELTGLNHNVLWEAGFSEALGRPVFYTCHKDFRDRVDRGEVTSDGKTLRWPFDVRNRNTIFWSADDFGFAAGKLKAMIRNTLPEEATQEDPEGDAK